jgi:hypothetical protein
MSKSHIQAAWPDNGAEIFTVADLFEVTSRDAPPAHMVAPAVLSVAVDSSSPQEYALGIISSVSGWGFVLCFEGYENHPDYLWQVEPVVMWLRALFRHGGFPLWERLSQSSEYTLSASQWWTVAFCPEAITGSSGMMLWPSFSEDFIRDHLCALNPEA